MRLPCIARHTLSAPKLPCRLPCAAAVLSLHCNNTHPAPRAARLGRQRRRSVFVPLSRVAEAGGTAPQTLVVVER